MSVRCSNSTETLTTTLTALTIGTGDFNMALWVRKKSNVAGDAGIVRLTTPSVEIYQYNASGVGGNGGGGYTYVDAAAMAVDTWYYIVLSRSASGLRQRKFDDSTSSTPIQTSTDAAGTGSITGVTNLVMGFVSGGYLSADMEIESLKIHTTTEWTDAECRTESQFYAIQKTGGTDRLAWKLQDVDADTDGLYEIGGSGPNLTNSGFTAGASTPSRLVAGEIGFDDGDGPVGMIVQGTARQVRLF